VRGARVSIIIPVFNREKLVSRAVQSCLGQTHKNVEVVCIDDGSTDASFEILSGLARADDRVRIFQNERCKGIAGARNTGLLRSTAEYVGFLDSDDAFKANHVENAISIFDQTNADWAFSNFERCLEDGKVIVSSVLGRNDRYIRDSFSELGRDIFVSRGDNHAVNFVKYMRAPGLHTSVVRRSAIAGLSFDERLEMFEDWKFRFDAICKGLSFAYLDLVTHRYYAHSGNTTNTAGVVDAAKKQNMAAAYRTLMSVVDNSVPQRDVRQAFKKKSASMLFWEFGIPMLRVGEWRNGWKLLLRSLLMDPLNADNLKAVVSILIKRRV
jgi:glycosyltransferase involved in cell wall biosynthesis